MGDDLLPILIYPAPMLKARAKPVTAADRETVAGLLPGMFAAMYAAPGIGLAAPQVGTLLRFCILDLGDGDERAPLTLVNPRVLAASEEQVVREEGCLSLPNFYADISRPARVRVAYEDVEGRPQEMEAEGLLATCVQHEIDHLDGVMFTDRLSALKRNMLLRRFIKEQKAGKGP